MKSLPIIRLRCVWLGGICVLCGCAEWAQPPASVEQKEWSSPAGEKGVEMLTDHFNIRVTAKDPELLEYLPTFMEGAYAAYEKMVPPVKESSDRLIVYVFADRDQWAQFTRVFSPANAETYLRILSGGYTDSPSGTAVAFDVRRDHTLSLLAHEGMHQYLSRHLPERIPAWINEGLATQFESFELNGPHPNFTPRHNVSRRTTLRELVSPKGELIPLADLLRMDAGDAVRGVRYQSRSYYAQVWSFVLFLMQGPCPPNYRQQFCELLADLGTERMTTAIHAQRAATPDGDKMSDGELLFRHYITEDLKETEAQYREFAEALLR